MMKKLACLFALGLAVGCGSTPAAEAPVAPTPEQPVADAPATPVEVDEGDWAQFWDKFKKAALAGDRATVLALCHVNEELPQETIDDYLFDAYLGEDMLGVIRKTDAAGVPVTEGTAGAADEVRELKWEDSHTEDGETFESALYFYFKKVDGKYRLFRVMAAG